MKHETFFTILVLVCIWMLQFADLHQTKMLDALTLGVAELIRREEQRAHESCMADGLIAGYCQRERDVEVILKSLKDGSIAK